MCGMNLYLTRVKPVLTRTIPFVFALLFVGQGPLMAQKMTKMERQQKRTIKKHYRKGKKYFKKQDYLRAQPFLKKCVSLDPEFAKAAFQLGVCDLKTGELAASLPHFIRAYNADQTVHPEIDYYLGQSLHINHHWEEAIFHYEIAASKLEDDDPLRQDIDNCIEQCERAPEILKREKPFRVENLGEFVNSKYPEYAPTFTDDYSHMIFTTRRPRKTYREAFGILHFYDIHEEVYNARLVDTVWMITELFSKPIPVNRHDAGIFMSDDGNMLIYYVDKNKGDVYVSYKDEEGKWSKRKSIGKNINTDHNEPSVFLVGDGQSLFYVSDKPGGFGKKDLYLSTRGPDDEWTEGENLGENFNTPYDEDAPFVTEDGQTLYFSSRGHNSVGGYDIFKSEKQADGTWGKPVNMGSPFNTTADDIYFVVDESQPDRYYFSSNREGGFGDMDNYMAVKSRRKGEECGETPIAGIVRDQMSGIGLEAKVFMLDAETGDTIGSTMTKAGSGAYAFTIPDCGYDYSMFVEVEGTPVQVSTETGSVNIVSGTIFDEISNQSLDATVELVDPETGKVLEQTWSSPKTGNYYLPIESGRNYLIRVKRNDYLSYYEEMRVSPSGQVEAHQKEIGLQPFREANNKIIVSWQFFETNKYSIKEIYSEDMENLYEVCKKIPNLRLKVVGHTDSDGSDDYNQKLSQRRAGEVARLLMDHGVSESRLEVHGMGERQPLYDNNDPRLKRWNRRVEISIIN